MKTFHLPAAAILAAVMTTPAAAAAATGNVTVSMAYYRSSGDYGLDSDTDTDYVPLTVAYDQGPWSFDLTVPWLRISGFGTVVMTRQGPLQMSTTSSSGRMGSGMTTSTTVVRVSESGLGDITAALGYSFLPENPDGLEATLSGVIKFPTGNKRKGLGTGETDYSLELDLSKPVADFSPFITVGYTITGDTNEITYNDFFYLSAGSYYTVSDDLEIGAAYDFTAKQTDDSDDGQEASIFMRLRMNDTWSVTFSAGAGLSDASPDSTYGLKLSAGF